DRARRWHLRARVPLRERRRGRRDRHFAARRGARFPQPTKRYFGVAAGRAQRRAAAAKLESRAIAEAQTRRNATETCAGPYIGDGKIPGSVRVRLRVIRL